VLQEDGRRPYRSGGSLGPNADEARVLRMIRAMSAGDEETAEAEALFLVPRTGVSRLIDRATPLTAFYSSAAVSAPRERCAATA
jgi:hypothetical protein